MKTVITSSLILSAIAIPAMVPAQVRMEEARPLVTTMPLVAKVKQIKSVVQIGRVPDFALQLHIWNGVKIARAAPAPPGGISAAGATIYVSKSWIEPPQPRRHYMCSGPPRRADLLDLSVPRRHGFQLAAFTIEPVPPPRNYVPITTGGPVRNSNGPPYLDANGQYTDRMADTAKITLSSPAFQFYSTPQMPVFCFAGYRVNLSLYGPTGIDPFTGKAIKPARVN